MAAPFKFTGSTGVVGTLNSGSVGATERMHPLLPTKVGGSNGFTVLLNGYNLNRRMTDLIGYDSTNAAAILPLQMFAPYNYVTPLVSYAGNGQLFGLGYKWRYRWYNSRTGEYSGLSPNPAASWNLGMETFPGSNQVLGQTAFFRIPTAGAPAGADTMQFFRNSSAEEEIWYMVEENSIVGVTYIEITDNYSDDDLFNTSTIVSTSQTSGPTAYEGVMPPTAKAHQHSSGRTFYFALRRMGSGRTNFADTSNYSNPVAGEDYIDSYYPVETGRVGQRLRLGRVNDSTVDDPAAYRIIRVEDNSIGQSRVYFYPPLNASTWLSTYVGDIPFRIEDDRDGRAVFMSEPGQPWLIDPIKTLYIGQDFSDEVQHFFTIDGVTFAQTRQAIYRLLNDQTEDPSLSTYITKASDEGSVGLEAGCETPFGWAYVHHGLGVRVFDGEKSMPMGGEDEYTVFIANTQFNRIDPDVLTECRLAWDHDKKVLLLSYVPLGEGSHSECLAFDPMTRTWRGPWRLRLLASGSVRTTSGDEVFVAGDDFGNLYKNDEQALDLVNPSATLTGTVGANHAVGTTIVTVGAFDTVNYMRGCPIWFKNPSTGIFYYSVVAYVASATSIYLQFPPVDENGNLAALTTSYTWAVGSIRWSMMTSYIDAGEPVLPKKIEHLLLRFRRGSAGGDFLVDVALDGDTSSFLGEKLSASSSPAITVSPTDSIFKKVRLSREGRAFTIRLRGQSTSGHPQITGAVAELDIRGGA